VRNAAQGVNATKSCQIVTIRSVAKILISYSIARQQNRENGLGNSWQPVLDEGAGPSGMTMYGQWKFTSVTEQVAFTLGIVVAYNQADNGVLYDQGEMQLLVDALTSWFASFGGSLPDPTQVPRINLAKRSVTVEKRQTDACRNFQPVATELDHLR